MYYYGPRDWLTGCVAADGGVQSDIYESMASGVQNAAVMVCFMTQEYEDSPNCALELKFVSPLLDSYCSPFLPTFSSPRICLICRLKLELQAKQSGVPIVPVLMQQGYTAAGCK